MDMINRPDEAQLDMPMAWFHVNLTCLSITQRMVIRFVILWFYCAHYDRLHFCLRL
uniref:Uncharacterized protein n=1 Tax=Anguilla anguilla TaxID=7936 RepID=A0A0E9UNG1_ANGAN